MLDTKAKERRMALANKLSKSILNDREVKEVDFNVADSGMIYFKVWVNDG